MQDWVGDFLEIKVAQKSAITDLKRYNVCVWRGRAKFTPPDFCSPLGSFPFVNGGWPCFSFPVGSGV